MANPCENTLYATGSEEVLDIISKFLKENFDADVEIEDDYLDAYFDSKWTFPLEAMEELFNTIPKQEDFYIRCLSVEYGCMYHALWYCDKNGWHDT